MTVFKRYTLYQIPSWILAIAIAATLHYWLGAPLWLAVALVTGYILKDFLLYPSLKRAYETQPAGAEQLIGEIGVAVQRLDREGYIRVRGELWRAEVARGGRPVAAGGRVRVQGVRGITLIVAEEEEDGR